MNRAEQLRTAIRSCLKCKLFPDTRFVIIDNNSSDNTGSVVRAELETSGYEYYYEKLEENFGVGRGRNYAFSKANSEYSYFLDDDAVIDYDKCPFFFKKAVEVFEDNDKIVTLTTQIYDELLKDNRVKIEGKKYNSEIYTCRTFCGGSHFLKNCFFAEPPYLPNHYGCEELVPSIKVVNEGKINGFIPTLLVYHCPKENKWHLDDVRGQRILATECAVPYAIKRMMYPKIVYPLVRMAYNRRCMKYLSGIDGGKEMADLIATDTINTYHIAYKVKCFSLVRMFFEFRLSIF